MWSSCDADGGTGAAGVRVGPRHEPGPGRGAGEDRPDPPRPAGHIGDITIGGSWGMRDADSPVLEGRLSSPRDLSESYDLLERKIVRPLERIPGVAQVRLDGVNPREVRINLRVDDLEAHGVDVRDVLRLLRDSNFDQSLGDDPRPGAALHPAHPGHLHVRWRRSPTCRCGRTGCVSPTWPTWSTRSRRWSTAGTWTATSPSGSR